ncbi:hypothetical protein [Demequina pelophila]|uniref:hypothetical protein n=1 Tax=Demequina pelophila TaxID=1638984 RepID=UPI0007804317|nr:hypothetical protein [Demequina pelophila]
MRRTAQAAAAALTLGLLAACTPSVPQPVTAPEDPQTSALLQPQVDRILESTFVELDAADEARDASLLGVRIASDAKLVRSAEYSKAAAEVADVDDIPSEMQAVYVSRSEDWPRLMAAVTAQPDDDQTPVVMMWLQEDVDSDYHLIRYAHMIPGATLPAMPGVAAGAVELELDAGGLQKTPEAAIADYLELVRQGEDSDLNDDFAEDSYRSQIWSQRSEYSATAEEGSGEFVETFQGNLQSTFALQAADGSALLFAPVYVRSVLSVTDGASITIPESQVPVLAGGSDNKSKITYEYYDLLVIHIPAEGADGKPALVAADHNLTRATSAD